MSLWQGARNSCGTAPLVVTPLMALAVTGIGAADAPSASSLLTITRNLGGAIGIAVLQTFLSRREQFHASRLSEALNLFDEGTRTRLDDLTQYFMAHGAGDPAVAWREAVAEVSAHVHEQAGVMAFADTFYLMGAAMIAALATAAIYRRPATMERAPAH
jgi:DHA2 family multidrug resistance protein